MSMRTPGTETTRGLRSWRLGLLEFLGVVYGLLYW